MKTYGRWAAEAVMLVALYAAYTVVRNELGSARVPYAVAAGHARHVLALERALCLDVEAGVQRLALGASWLVRAAGAYYRWPHLWAVIAMLVTLRLRRPHHYGPLRTALVVTLALALAGFALFPLAPPRLLPELGFADTVRLPPWRWTSPPDVSGWRFAAMATNQFAAMPSVHVAFATWVVLAARQACSRHVRLLAGTHLVFTSLAVVVTANHWVLDGAAGGMTTLAAWAVARWATSLAGSRRGLPTPAPAR